MAVVIRSILDGCAQTGQLSGIVAIAIYIESLDFEVSVNSDPPLIGLIFALFTHSALAYL